MLTILHLILTMSSLAHNVASHAHNIASHAHNVASLAYNVASHAHNVTSHAHNVASCSQCRFLLTMLLLAHNAVSCRLVSLKIFLARQVCERKIECVYILALQIGKARFFYVSQVPYLP